MLRKGFLFPAVVLSFIVLLSCSAERKLAVEYVRKREPASALLIAPDFSYRYNFKIPDIENFYELSAEQKDSALFFSSDLLQYINDSTLFAAYLSGLSTGLGNYGFRTYSGESARKFIESGSDGLIINLAQLELEEYLDSISDEGTYSEEENYNYQFYLNAINFNSWFEIARVNKQDTTLVLYTSNKITDKFQGGYQYFPYTGDVKYYYSIDSITVDDVYNSAYSYSYYYAGLIFDYLMNDYIRTHLPPGVMPVGYYTYDRISGIVRKGFGQRLIRIR
jgi:hypothetical protein